jgi:hypothetical protein
MTLFLNLHPNALLFCGPARLKLDEIGVTDRLAGKRPFCV